MLEEDDAKLFLHGACHLFALALHERFRYPIVVLRDLTAVPQKSATHVYCRFSQIDSVDVVGIAPEKIALADLGWHGANYRPVETLPDELESYFTTVAGGGLYADPDFLSVTRTRAHNRIHTYGDYYSGAIRLAIPGASRI